MTAWLAGLHFDTPALLQHAPCQNRIPIYFQWLEPNSRRWAFSFRRHETTPNRVLPATRCKEWIFPVLQRGQAGPAGHHFGPGFASGLAGQRCIRLPGSALTLPMTRAVKNADVSPHGQVGASPGGAVTFGYNALHPGGCPTSQGYIPAAKYVACRTH